MNTLDIKDTKQTYYKHYALIDITLNIQFLDTFFMGLENH